MDSDRAVFEADARLQQAEGPNVLPAKTTVPDGAPSDAHESSPLLGDSRRESPERDRQRAHSPPAWDGMADFKGLPWWRQPNTIWLVIPFLLLAMTFGATIVPMINVVKELLCRNIVESRNRIDPQYPLLQTGPGEENEICNSDKEVNSQVAMFQLYAQVLGGLLSAIASPKLGALSDRYGRLRILAITSIGGLAKDAFIITIYYNSQSISVWWFLLAYAIDGVCGSFTAGMALSHAYASDCTPPDKRAMVFGWFHGALFTGVAIGPIAAGLIIQATGNLVYVFWIAMGFHLACLTALFFIPESLSKRRQREAQARHKMKLDADDYHHGPPETYAFNMIVAWFKRHNIFEPLQILVPTGPGTSWDLRKNLIILAAVDTITFGTAIGAMTVVILYVGNIFHWNTVDTSGFVSVVNMSRVTTLLVVLPIVTRIVRGPQSTRKPRESGCDHLDLYLIRISVVFDTLGYIGYALAPTGGWMIAAGVVASIGAIGSPILQSSLTKHVPPSKVGQLLGATGLLHALARVVTPAVFNFIYARTVKIDMPGVVFWVLSASFAIAFLCSMFLKPNIFLDERATEHAEREDEREEAMQRDAREEEDVVM